jgi:tetratricopeptide (TPR) repeat protein
VQGKAATLHNMAGVIAQQGDVTRALELWNQSLVILEQIGDVKGKAATLNNMAGVIAQQGGVTRALELWNQSLQASEQIGDVKGKAATLANMAWLAGKQGDSPRECQLNLESARLLASIRAWLDLARVLGNLGASNDPHATTFLAQALWLAVRVEVPADLAVSLAAALLEKLGPQSESAPLVATAGLFLAQVRGASHPRREQMQQLGTGMLSACAAERKIAQDKLMDWLASEGLNDPARFLPALARALEALVGESAWLFDRQLLSKEA